MASPRINQHNHTKAGVVLAAEMNGFTLYENHQHENRANFFFYGETYIQEKVNGENVWFWRLCNNKTTDMKHSTRFDTLPSLS